MATGKVIARAVECNEEMEPTGRARFKLIASESLIYITDSTYLFFEEVKSYEDEEEAGWPIHCVKIFTERVSPYTILDIRMTQEEFEKHTRFWLNNKRDLL